MDILLIVITGSMVCMPRNVINRVHAALQVTFMVCQSILSVFNLLLLGGWPIGEYSLQHATDVNVYTALFMFECPFPISRMSVETRFPIASLLEKPVS